MSAKTVIRRGMELISIRRRNQKKRGRERYHLQIQGGRLQKRRKLGTLEERREKKKPVGHFEKIGAGRGKGSRSSHGRIPANRNLTIIKYVKNNSSGAQVFLKKPGLKEKVIATARPRPGESNCGRTLSGGTRQEKQAQYSWTKLKEAK